MAKKRKKTKNGVTLKDEDLRALRTAIPLLDKREKIKKELKVVDSKLARLLTKRINVRITAARKRITKVAKVMRRKLQPFSKMALEILKRKGKAMRAAEVTRALLKKGFKVNPRYPAVSVVARRLARMSGVKRVRKGIYTAIAKPVKSRTAGKRRKKKAHSGKQ